MCILDIRKWFWQSSFFPFTFSSCPLGSPSLLPGLQSATHQRRLRWQQLGGVMVVLLCPNTVSLSCVHHILLRHQRCTIRSPTLHTTQPIINQTVSRFRSKNLNWIEKWYCCHGKVWIFSALHFFPSCSPAGSYYPSTLHPPHKSCMARFLRSSNVPESSLPPSIGPPPSSYPSDPQTPHPPSSSSTGYPPHPPRDRMGPPAFHPHPGQPQYGPLAPAHGVYAPLYDSRRVWRPQVRLLLIIALSCWF